MKSRSLVLLSGERGSFPAAEARALFLTYDPDSKFEAPEDKIIIATSSADPFLISSRVAFSRRVGILLNDKSEIGERLRGMRMRYRGLKVVEGRKSPDPVRVLRGLDLEVDLKHPEFELTQILGRNDYFVLTKPLSMVQAWSKRRPRVRAYFHPSAIFPKLARALVNLSRCKKGDIFLDPFCGTGSLPIEASLVGARVVAMDQDSKMAKGSLANMRRFGQNWLGVVRGDTFHPPIGGVDSVATDLPYGRVSSTRGQRAERILENAIGSLPLILRPGSRAIIMHANTVVAKSTGDLVVEEEHELYIHRLLTRTITILKRR